MAPLSDSYAATGLLAIRTAAILTILWLVQCILRAIYNISPFHPCHQIPGPKLAASSYLYEFYFDFIKWGRYINEIQRMHEKYGPIVRINPDEVHCTDPNFIDEIYPVSGRKRNKPYWHVKNLVGPALTAGFSTQDHDLHRLRRVPLQKIFSKATIANLEPVIHDLAQQLCNKLLAQADSKRGSFDLTAAYSCYTSDVVASYCFGESFGFLEQESFEPNFRRAVFSILNTRYFFKFFPWLKQLMKVEPYLRKYMPEDMTILNKTLHVTIPRLVRQAQAEYEAGIVKAIPTVFDALYESDLPPEEKSVYRHTGEALILLSAGTETASWTLSVTTFHILNNPSILSRLTAELEKAVSDPRKLPTWSTLENLPYLSAVINEGLRLSYGIVGRTSRVPVEEDLHYHGTWTPPLGSSSAPVTVSYIVPRGTAASMSSYITHHDEMIFPDSHEFLPDRWFDENGLWRKDLERCLLSFSKGSRQCLGMNLARCELTLALAALVLRVLPRMHLHETTTKDVKFDFDLGVPMVEKGSKGVFVLVT
ncbi:related to trichodiene oxygenase cytochrome P450 [Phialocephala subalpina]|uniref:Related to trichodiene oxygenase cytochrome P450 n=1 Tax=Phialocephala subalpina TaxID=576137 RepID=A0A1L7WFB2_9HELO|nr:related to trichodiene oxygenase cytochrome P450 [Phialocephala subalpina]